MDKRKKPNRVILSAMVIGMCSLGFQGVGFANPNSSSKGPEATTSQKIVSGAATMVYFPAKVVYAGLGGIVGGLAYVFTGGNLETAEIVWKPTTTGTYVITPEQLWGDEPIEFFGKPVEVHPKLTLGSEKVASL